MKLATAMLPSLSTLWLLVLCVTLIRFRPCRDPRGSSDTNQRWSRSRICVRVCGSVAVICHIITIGMSAGLGFLGFFDNSLLTCFPTMVGISTGIGSLSYHMFLLARYMEVKVVSTPVTRWLEVTYFLAVGTSFVSFLVMASGRGLLQNFWICELPIDLVIFDFGRDLFIISILLGLYVSASRKVTQMLQQTNADTNSKTKHSRTAVRLSSAIRITTGCFCVHAVLLGLRAVCLSFLRSEWVCRTYMQVQLKYINMHDKLCPKLCNARPCNLKF